MGRQRTYTDAQVADAVASCTSMSDVLRRLGIKVAGGSHFHMRNRVVRMGLDTSHFRNTTAGRGTSNRRKAATEILVVRPEGSNREDVKRLRRALSEIGRPAVCELCGLDDSWMGLPIVLEIDHIDGNPLDNRAENLRFLCPNCHSQCDTNKPWKAAA
ncbi:HNH endonuclease signature motif containing protein [Mycolicibacterium palauense]|uniref:HNH endonuclease signature motif containing protein n=1 Tax=Mycolicibacterium palauense TaxID=2034511 RepID=UPI000BFED2FE|nr:HNH endonuclease [Mycolicibacterium palauense]